MDHSLNENEKMAEVGSEPKLDRLSKENRWYYKAIDDHVSLESRRLLEEYSHIPSDEVDLHIYKLVIEPLLFPSLTPMFSLRLGRSMY